MKIKSFLVIVLWMAAIISPTLAQGRRSAGQQDGMWHQPFEAMLRIDYNN